MTLSSLPPLDALLQHIIRPWLKSSLDEGSRSPLLSHVC
jgi:hypothetical protein